MTMDSKTEQLVNHLSEKTGISKEVAVKVVQVLLQYFRDHLPKPIVEAIEAYLAGKSPVGNVMKTIGGLSGLFGGGEEAKK